MMAKTVYKLKLGLVLLSRRLTAGVGCMGKRLTGSEMPEAEKRSATVNSFFKKTN
jgi:hypothetical protein